MLFLLHEKRYNTLLPKIQGGQREELRFWTLARQSDSCVLFEHRHRENPCKMGGVMHLGPANEVLYYALATANRRLCIGKNDSSGAQVMGGGVK